MSVAARLRAESLEDRQAAIAEITAGGPAGDAELQALVECLAHPRKVVQRPAADAFAALAIRGIPVRAVLEPALTAAEFGQRWGAAFALSRLGEPPPASVPVLLEALATGDGDVRWAAADILLRVADRDDLVERLRSRVASGTAAARKMALYCLRDLDARTPEIEAVVVRALDDAERDVRLAAVSAIARLALDRAGAAAGLVAVLEEDADERVRRAAAAALGAVGDRSDVVLGALEAASTGDDASLRRAADGALRRLRAVP